MITKDSVSLKEFTVELCEELKSLLEKCWAVSDSDDIITIVTWGQRIIKTFSLSLCPPKTCTRM